jgi:hypothetical protein
MKTNNKKAILVILTTMIMSLEAMGGINSNVNDSNLRQAGTGCVYMAGEAEEGASNVKGATARRITGAPAGLAGSALSTLILWVGVLGWCWFNRALINDKKNKIGLIVAIFSIIGGVSATFIKDIISYCGIINVSKSDGINNMIIYLISWISVFIVGFIVCSYLKKRIKHNTE